MLYSDAGSSPVAAFGAGYDNLILHVDWAKPSGDEDGKGKGKGDDTGKGGGKDGGGKGRY
jgi:hypothetical protein